jgi:processive 1,2-diacylglycerol beta-glucosyltransferase
MNYTTGNNWDKGEKELNYKGLSILYLSVGSGHQVAAEALEDALYEQEPDLSIKVDDPFSKRRKWIIPLLSFMQSAANALAPDIYDLTWRREMGSDRFDWIANIGILSSFLWKNLDARNSDTIIATHAFPCNLAVGLKKKALIKKVFGVITDFGLNSSWPLENIDGYFVPHEELRQILIYQKFDPKKVFVTGIPIKKSFGDLPLKSSQIKSDILRILIVAGGIRGGNYMGLKKYIRIIIDGLQQLNEQRIHLTIITGNKLRLMKELLSYKEQVPYELEVLGFVKDMETIMANHDILITKPGGLILSEALAIGMCLILIHPGPGQERANVEFLARHGAALRGETPKEVLSTIINCIENKYLVDEIKENAKELGASNSSQIIASQIISQLADRQ